MEDAELEQDEQKIELADNEQWMHFYPDSKGKKIRATLLSVKNTGSNVVVVVLRLRASTASAQEEREEGG